MGYADRTVNIYDKKVFGLTEWGTRLRDYIEDVARGIDRGIHPVPGILFTPIDLDITVADEFTFTPTTSDYDSGLGHVIEDVPAAVLEHVPFENAAVTDYDVGVKRIQIPYLTETCVRDGKVQYRAWEERIGDMAVPAAVVYAAGTLSIEPGSVAELGHDFTGRQFVVWLNTPVVDGAGAIEVCTGYFNAGQTWVDLVGTLGQGVTPSVVAADYRVALLGPMVKKFSSLKSSTIGIVYIGTITGGGAGNPPAAKDLTDQFVYPDMGSGWYDIFEVCAHGNTKVRVRAYAADGAGEPQISVLEDTTGNRTWQVQRDGDMEMGNAVDWPVVSPAIKFVTTTRTADIYLDPGVTDYLRIVPSVATVRTKIVSNVVEIEEGIEAVGTLKFDDANTGAQVSFSSATDTAIDAALPQNVIGAINEQARTAAALSTIFRASLLSGGAVTMPGGLNLDVAGGTCLQSGQLKTYVAQTILNVVANCYVFADASGGVYATKAALPLADTADVLLAYVAAGGGGPTAVTDLRKFLLHVNERDEILVGTISAGGTLVAGAHFATITEAVALINAVQATENRVWKIQVVGRTDEPAAVLVPDNVEISGVGNGLAASTVRWAHDGALFDLSGTDRAWIHGLRVEHTGANPPPVAGTRMVFANPAGITSYVAIEDISLAGVIDLNGFAGFANIFAYGRIAHVYADRLRDWGIGGTGSENTLDRCRLTCNGAAVSGLYANSGIYYLNAADSVIRDCESVSFHGAGIYLDTCSKFHISGGRVSTPDLAGLYLDDSEDNKVVGLSIVGSNQTAGLAGIELVNNSDNNVFQACQVYATPPVVTAIMFGANADNNVAVGNNFRGLAIADAAGGAGNFYQTAAPDAYPLNS